MFDVHEKRKNELAKPSPAFSLKTVHPSSLERQNVKRALNILRPSTSAALRTTELQHAARFIQVYDVFLLA